MARVYEDPAFRSYATYAPFVKRLFDLQLVSMSLTEPVEQVGIFFVRKKGGKLRANGLRQASQASTQAIRGNMQVSDRFHCTQFSLQAPKPAVVALSGSLQMIRMTQTSTWNVSERLA